MQKEIGRQLIHLTYVIEFMIGPGHFKKEDAEVKNLIEIRNVLREWLCPVNQNKFDTWLSKREVV